ncbi:MAG: SDR family oxidoreductase [Deltaproteobacteria bacterium]|nr:SDR family oxidoreductase [Deltaproteobacteria bacterium]
MRRDNSDLLTAAAFIGGAFLAGRWIYRRTQRRDLRYQVVLVTGGSRGLGLALSRALLDQGCHLAICARDEGELDRARQELKGHGRHVLMYQCDVTDRASVNDMVQAVLQDYGGIDILVNNAGMISVGPLDSMTLGDFEKSMAVNFWGPLNVVWSVLPHMREQGGGHIVNVTSFAGQVPVPHLVPYDCSKAAFMGLSEGMRAELARDNIDVTTVIPGLLHTGSPVNAEFKGNPEAEFAWFSASDSMPLTSMSADRAARLIVASMRQGGGQLTLGWQAKLLRAAHAVAPNAFSRALSVFNRYLPEDQGLPFTRAFGVELKRSANAATQARVDQAGAHLNQHTRPTTP